MAIHNAIWSFIPHGYCYLWQPELIELHVISDALIAFAYYAISIALIHFVDRRQDLPFNWIFLLFGVFVTTCGTTHILEIWAFWHPAYWLSGTLKAITAIVSVCTVLLLPLLFPKAIAFPNPTELEIANQRLEQEISERKRVEAELEAQRSFLRQVIDTVPSAIFVKDQQGYIVAVNHASAVIHGSTVEAMLGKREPDFNANFAPAQLENFLAINRTVMATRQSQTSCQFIVTAQGQQRWYQTTISPFVDITGQVQGIIGNSVDITELKQAETALLESEIRFRTLIQELNVGVVLHGPNTEVLLSNPASLKFLGLTEDQLLGKTLFDPDWNVIHDDGSAFSGTEHPVPQAIVTQRPVRNVVMGVYRPQFQDRIWLLVSAEPQLEETGQVKQVICTFSDISERKRVEDLLQQLARVDSLTQVANRRHFDEYFSQEWQRLSRERDYLALMLCDVDFFKRYNDHYGHQAGDRCLIQVAQAIQKVLKRPTDFVSRYGGEEFAVVLPHTSVDGAIHIAQTIQTTIAQLQLPHLRSQVSNCVTLSIGIASTIPTQSSSFEALVAIADKALYVAKANGRNTYCAKIL